MPRGFRHRAYLPGASSQDAIHTILETKDVNQDLLFGKPEASRGHSWWKLVWRLGMQSPRPRQMSAWHLSGKPLSMMFSYTWQGDGVFRTVCGRLSVPRIPLPLAVRQPRVFHILSCEAVSTTRALGSKPRQNSLYEIGEISRPSGIGVSRYR